MSDAVILYYDEEGELRTYVPSLSKREFYRDYLALSEFGDVTGDAEEVAAAEPPAGYLVYYTPESLDLATVVNPGTEYETRMWNDLGMAAAHMECSPPMLEYRDFHLPEIVGGMVKLASWPSTKEPGWRNAAGAESYSTSYELLGTSRTICFVFKEDTLNPPGVIVSIGGFMAWVGQLWVGEVETPMITVGAQFDANPYESNGQLQVGDQFGTGDSLVLSGHFNVNTTLIFRVDPSGLLTIRANGAQIYSNNFNCTTYMDYGWCKVEIDYVDEFSGDAFIGDILAYGSYLTNAECEQVEAFYLEKFGR